MPPGHGYTTVVYNSDKSSWQTVGPSWTRGLAAQYDAWSDLLEADEASVGWNWDSMFSYMKKVRGVHPVHSYLALMPETSV